MFWPYINKKKLGCWTQFKPHDGRTLIRHRSSLGCVGSATRSSTPPSPRRYVTMAIRLQWLTPRGHLVPSQLSGLHLHRTWSMMSILLILRKVTPWSGVLCSLSSSCFLLDKWLLEPYDKTVQQECLMYWSPSNEASLRAARTLHQKRDEGTPTSANNDIVILFNYVYVPLPSRRWNRETDEVHWAQYDLRLISHVCHILVYHMCVIRYY